MGSTLYDLLIPSELKQALWENRTKIKYLNILSPTEPMPWELLYLSDPSGSGDAGFLVDGATVTRWRYGPPPRCQFSKNSPYFVLPNGAPDKAQQEVTHALPRLGLGKVITELDDLLELLKAGQFSLLHFASHNVANPMANGGLYIPFGNAKFDITSMGGRL
jgi:hypothetical protein